MTPATSPDLGPEARSEDDRADAPPSGWATAREQAALDAALDLLEPNGRWDDRLVARAASAIGLSAADAALLLPNGAGDLAALLWRRHDAAALAALGPLDPGAMKVRARIRAAVLARVEAAAVDTRAVEASAPFLAQPRNLALAARLGWSTADGLWRWAGDTATDQNHYSKRAILAGVLAGAMRVRLGEGREASERWVDDRIEGVMRFEAWKAKLPRPSAVLPAAAGWLGRLRYGPRGA